MKNRIVENSNILKILNQLLYKYEFHENLVISCIFKNTKILSFGISKPFNESDIYGLHAEIKAYSNLCSKFKKKELIKLKNIDILTTRFIYDKKLKKTILKTSAPCQFCIKNLYKIQNIKHVYYTNEDQIIKTDIIELYNNIHKFNFSSGDKRIHKY